TAPGQFVRQGHRKKYPENRTFAHFGVHRDAGAEAFDYAVHHRETEPSALAYGAGGEEGLENAGVASAWISGTVSAKSVRISILGGASAEKRFNPSLTTLRRSIGVSRAASSCRVKVRIFLTTSLAR